MAPATADFIPLPIKWSQPIQFNLNGVITGVDRLSDETRGVVMADDFTCNDPRPIVAVRWWGPYIRDTVNHGTVTNVPFDISFHLSLGTHPGSLPDASPLSYQLVRAEQEFVGYDLSRDAVYRYDAYLTTPFNQVFGTEYFMDIDNHGHNWGWHDSNPVHPIDDWAAVGNSHTGPWLTFQNNTDLAFELMVPEPNTWLIGSLGAGLLWVLQWRRRRG